MVQAYGVTGLRNYAEAVKALEFVIDATPNATFQQYAQLAVLAHGAKQTRKATLAADKAVSLAPKSQRKTLADADQDGPAAARRGRRDVDDGPVAPPSPRDRAARGAAATIPVFASPL